MNSFLIQPVQVFCSARYSFIIIRASPDTSSFSRCSSKQARALVSPSVYKTSAHVVMLGRNSSVHSLNLSSSSKQSPHSSDLMKSYDPSSVRDSAIQLEPTRYSHSFSLDSLRTVSRG